MQGKIPKNISKNVATRVFFICPTFENTAKRQNHNQEWEYQNFQTTDKCAVVG